MPGPLPSRRRPEASPWPMVVAMIVASLGVHLVLWPVGNQVLAISWDAPPLPAAGGIMEVSLLGPEDEPEPPNPVLQPEEQRLPGQLVNPDEVLDQRKPDRTNRISEFDSRVDKETRAPNRKQAEVYDPTRMGEQSGVGAQPNEGEAAQDMPTHALPLGRLDPGKTQDRDRSGQADGASDLRAREQGQGTAPRPGFRGNADAMRKTFGGSGTFDHLPDVEEGTQNILNSERFRFASFFNRMRDQIAQHWDPNAAMARADPDGRVYGRTTRRTLLHIRLTPKGAVKKIDIVRPSGVRELDAEAIESVHLAAPFVNPPPQMIDARTGFIEVDFMFILEEGKTSRIRRYLR